MKKQKGNIGLLAVIVIVGLCGTIAWVEQSAQNEKREIAETQQWQANGCWVYSKPNGNGGMMFVRSTYNKPFILEGALVKPISICEDKPHGS
jgi:uncharacterized membrane protein (UPF0127 family)